MTQVALPLAERDPGSTTGHEVMARVVTSSGRRPLPRGAGRCAGGSRYGWLVTTSGTGPAASELDHHADQPLGRSMISRAGGYVFA